MREMMSQLGSNPGLLGKIPGMGRLAGAGGGMDPTALLGGGMGGKPGKQPKQAAGARGRQKGKRKNARKARKKNRRR